MKIEENKNEEEQREFRRLLAESICSEIKDHLGVLGELETSSKAPNPKDHPDILWIYPHDLQTVLFKMNALRRSYTEMPIEKRIKMFQPDIFAVLELGYRYYNQLITDLQYKIDNNVINSEGSITHSKNDIDECRKNLNSASVRLVIYRP